MTSTATQPDLVTALVGRWKQVNEKFTALARAFPEALLAYRPTDGVRSPGDVLRHVAFWNQYVAESARGEQPDGTANELPGSAFSTKAQLLDALERNSTEAADALSSAAPDLGVDLMVLAVSFIEHTSGHYGQLVAYARLKGIVPPASVQ